MEAIRKSIEIHAPVERVFAYLADPNNDPEWLPSLLEVRNISGSAANLRHEWTFKMVGMKLDGTTQVVEHVPNERLVTTTQGGADSTWTYALATTPSGTRLDISIEYEVPIPVLGRLAEKLVVRSNEREIELAIQNIKDHCES